MSARRGDGIFYNQQLTINASEQALNTSSGALQIAGGLGITKAAHVGEQLVVQGNVTIGGDQLYVNSKNITPSLGDIVAEQEQELVQTNAPTDITDLQFINTITRSFVATVSVDVDAPSPKNALWELHGVLKSSGWVMSTWFTGDVTDVSFGIRNATSGDTSYGQVTYTNANGEGTTTTIRFRASTVSPTGAPNTAISLNPENVVGAAYTLGDVAFNANSLPFSDSNGALTTNSQLRYYASTNEVALGGLTKLSLTNTANATSATAGGSLVVAGGAAVAKGLYVGTDLHFGGSLYQNGFLMNATNYWGISGSDISYTSGNVVLSNALATNSSLTNVVLAAATATSLAATTYTGGSVALSGAAAFATGVTTATLLATTSISTGTLLAANGMFAAATVPNILLTNASASSLVTTNAIVTNASLTNVVLTAASATSIAATTYTGGSIALSGAAAFATGVTTATLLATTSISTGTLSAANGLFAAATATSLAAGTYTGGSIALSGSAALSHNSNTVGAIITTGGNVGIGTTNPLHRLDVTGALRVTSGGLMATFNSNTLGSVVTTGGNVGVGTTAPTQTIDVVGGARFSVGVTTATLLATTSVSTGSFAAANGTLTNIVITSASATSLAVGTYTGGSIALSGSAILSHSSHTIGSIITNNGFVGIGTTLPGYQLTFTGHLGMDNGSAMVAKNSAGSYETFLWPRTASNTMLLNYGSAGFNIRNNSSTTTMFMTNGGNVGIGTTNPSSNLHIYNSANDTYPLYLGTPAVDIRLGPSATTYNGLSGALIVGRAGYWACALNAGGVANVSDVRLKRDIEYQENELDKLLQLNLVTYRYKTMGDDVQKSYGFIAQDVESIYPEFVSTINFENAYTGSDNVKIMGYERFGPLAVQGIKELYNKFNEEKQDHQETKQRLATVETTLADVLTRLSALETGGA